MSNSLVLKTSLSWLYYLTMHASQTQNIQLSTNSFSWFQSREYDTTLQLDSTTFSDRNGREFSPNKTQKGICWAASEQPKLSSLLPYCGSFARCCFLLSRLFSLLSLAGDLSELQKIGHKSKYQMIKVTTVLHLYAIMFAGKGRNIPA